MNDSNPSFPGGMVKDRLSRIDRVLQEVVDRGEVAGVVALVTRHGEETYFGSYGWLDKENHKPIQRDTIFRIASMTKPIIAAAVMTLVEENRLRLLDPVDKWLPELADRRVLRDPKGDVNDTYPSPRPITLHDLLTFRPGIGWGESSIRMQLLGLLPDPLGPTLGIPGTLKLGPDDWMKRLGELPLLYPPGERWLYHIPMDILGVLLARVTDQPLETALKERLFDPLEMKDTGFSVPEGKRDRFSVLYMAQKEGGLVVRDDPQNSGWNEPPLFPSGGGGLVSTVDDYQRFGLMLLNQGRLEKTRILSRKSVEAMTTDYLTPEQHKDTFGSFDKYDADRSGMWDNRGFGYGVAVRTRRVGLGPNVGAFFWPGAFGTTFMADPAEDLMVTLLVQQLSTNPFYTQLGEDFLNMTYQAIAD